MTTTAKSTAADRNAMLEEAAKVADDCVAKWRAGQAAFDAGDDPNISAVSLAMLIAERIRALTTTPEPTVSEREDAVPHPMARCIHCGQMHVEHDRVGNTYICAGPTGVRFQAALQTINERGDSA